MDAYFDHERLEVYQLAREYSREVRKLIDELPRGHAESKDNLRRAVMSITRNLAEGSGKWLSPDKTNFYHHARASTCESAASLDELVDWADVPVERVRPLHAMGGRLTAMIINLIKSVESRTRKPDAA